MESTVQRCTLAAALAEDSDYGHGSSGSAFYDREVKRGAYLALGVHEYWLVDLRSRSIEIWAPGARMGTIVTDSLTWRPASLGREIVLELREIFGEMPREAF